MALSPRFLDEVKARLTLSDVVGKKVRLMKRGKEHMGLCPFHSEKTPSFTVNDQKGFYHCFGCGAHGSAIDFVMETEAMGFRDAVESLAGQAGLAMPEETPEDRARAETRKTLTEVMQAAADWYAAQLHSKIGASALDYAKGRGLRDETIKRFAMGYAPRGRTALKDAMLARKIPESDLIETGMLIKPEDGGPSYDRFRDRLMFPITDRRGQVIAFGGRALSPDAKAKYLNSPDTPLFHKGHTLYNWAGARKAAFDSGELLVVEGYMDVIALAEAGMDHAVAPLGTALTEEQILHCWAMSDEPVLAFDGDKAGARAAARAADRALPLLKPGKSLRFLLLPAGEDPDTLVRKAGRAALEERIDAASALVDLLWRELTDGVRADTPERLAGLEKKLFSHLGAIEDEAVRKLYMREFGDRIWKQFKARKPQGQSGGRRGAMSAGRRAPSGYPSRLKNTAIGSQQGTTESRRLIERQLCSVLANHPEVIIRYEDMLSSFSFSDPGLEAIRSRAMMALTQNVPLERVAFQDYLRQHGCSVPLQDLLTDMAMRRQDWFAFEEAALTDALKGVEQVLARLNYYRLRADCDDAKRDYEADMTEENRDRFLAVQAELRAAEKLDVTIDGFGLASGRKRSM